MHCFRLSLCHEGVLGIDHLQLSPYFAKSASYAVDDIGCGELISDLDRMLGS